MGLRESQVLDFINQVFTMAETSEWGLGRLDDAALIKKQGLSEGLLVSKDLLLDGVHFDVKTQDLRLIGKKCLSVNLSDMAAMGAWPRFIFLGLSIPKSWDFDQLKALIEGLAEGCKRYDLNLCGGDTCFWDGPLVCSITMLGQPHPKGPALRNGAHHGDLIFVSGALGHSILGHHLNFEPRLELARKLMHLGPPSSMADISDGLATDLRHILTQSQLGARLWAEKIPLRPGALAPNKSPLDHALSDGEDFELVFTLSPLLASQRSWQKLIDDKEIYPIGFCTKTLGQIELLDAQGKTTIYHSKGYEHGL